MRKLTINEFDEVDGGAIAGVIGGVVVGGAIGVGVGALIGLAAYLVYEYVKSP